MEAADVALDAVHHAEQVARLQPRLPDLLAKENGSLSNLECRTVNLGVQRGLKMNDSRDLKDLRIPISFRVFSINILQ